jgi:hypothetical protein
MKKIVLFLCILISKPVLATSLDQPVTNSGQFIEIYRKFFEHEIVANLSATRSELNAVLTKRNQILDHMNNNSLNIPEEELNREWQAYIKKNFKTIDEFGKYLEESFIKEFELKERFKQNLYFSKYFNEIIVPKIKTDFETRKKIIEFAQINNIEISDTQFKEALYQMAENWGGTDNFNVFLSKNNISLLDIGFYLRSELLKNKIIDNYLEQKLLKGSELANSIDSLALNEYNIVNQKNRPLYFFKQAFISKDFANALAKIEEYYNTIQKKENPKLEKTNNNEIIVEDVKIYVDPNSDLLAPAIKQSIIELSNDGLFVSPRISPIITSKSGYHIFQLNKILVPENENIQKIKNKKIQKLRDEYTNNLNDILEEMSKKNQ